MITSFSTPAEPVNDPLTLLALAMGCTRHEAAAAALHEVRLYFGHEILIQSFCSKCQFKAQVIAGTPPPGNIIPGHF